MLRRREEKNLGSGFFTKAQTVTILNSLQAGLGLSQAIGALGLDIIKISDHLRSEGGKVDMEMIGDAIAKGYNNKVSSITALHKDKMHDIAAYEGFAAKSFVSKILLWGDLRLKLSKHADIEDIVIKNLAANVQLHELATGLCMTVQDLTDYIQDRPYIKVALI